MPGFASRAGRHLHDAMSSAYDLGSKVSGLGCGGFWLNPKLNSKPSLRPGVKFIVQRGPRVGCTCVFLWCMIHKDPCAYSLYTWVSCAFVPKPLNSEAYGVLNLADSQVCGSNGSRGT